MYTHFKVVSGTGKFLGYTYTKEEAENLADHCILNDDEKAVHIIYCLDKETELSCSFITNERGTK
jgi:hypothetical protein